MDELDILALVPRAKGINLEEMLVRAFVAKTGREPTQEELNRLLPKLEELRHLSQLPITYKRKWVG